ncbi:unnamed protein product [Brachionus calyciflorus]|uniref:PLAT domain-containing protein n=1 Tax=Brachionus calyciflorus TaxID=104777 RepID=A0A813MIE5_9BILA|nr:unnamed protein product [Brachionus calyciflorus]
MFRDTTWIRGRQTENENYADRLNHLDLNRIPRLSLDESKLSDYKHEENNPKFSYCYLCSIGAHEHKKTQPVPMNKRRYLKPYLNPVQILKKYEKDQMDTEIKTKYKFIVKTGVGLYAGTDCNVMFKLYGTAGIWETTELKPKGSSNTEKFPSNSLVEIELNGPVIGDLKKLKIWHNGKSIKDGWYLDFIEITCYAQMQTWRFVCDQWLSTHRPPNNSNTAIISLNNNSIFNNEKIRNMTEYFFIFKTSGKPLTGKDINIQFQFTAAKYQSQVFNLLTPYVNLFDRNQLDCFMVSTSHDLGAPEKLRLAHNSRKMTHDWFIEYIKVLYSKEPNKLYVYKVDKWLDKNDRMNAIISLQESLQINQVNDEVNSNKKVYHISVITGRVKFAGTDSRVFIEMKGTRGMTKAHRLHNSKAKKEFERGQTDHFQIFDDDIGDIKMIRVWHDNSGSAPGWFLEAVLIRSMSTTISGNESKQDYELYRQLDKISKKIKIKDLKPDELEKLEDRSTKRSKSAELRRKVKPRVAKRTRSASADLKRRSSMNDNEFKKSERTSTPSILKTPNSPRTRRDMMKKHVKFEQQSNDKLKNEKKEDKTAKIDMILNWVMSINYHDDSKTIKNVRTIENYDKSIKNIDNKLVTLYESKLSKSTASSTKENKSDVQQTPLSPRNSKQSIQENLIHVFECNKWLAKDMEDRQTERIIRLIKSINQLEFKNFDNFIQQNLSSLDKKLKSIYLNNLFSVTDSTLSTFLNKMDNLGVEETIVSNLKLPKFILNLTNFKNLDTITFKSNQIENFEIYLGYKPKNLNIVWNEIRKFKLKNCQNNLEYLDLIGNDLNFQLPTMPNLISLHLDNNNFNSIQKDLFGRNLPILKFFILLQII